MFLLAPKSEAKTTSRSRPRMRLHKIAIPTTPVARVLTRRPGAVAISANKEQRLGVYESEISV